MDQFSLAENVDTLFHSLENFTQKEGIIGKPVTQGSKTLLPVVSVTVGYGGGNAAMGSKGQQQSGSASASGSSATGALGLGAKLSTDAVIVIDDTNQNISMLPMTGSATGQLMDKIPQIISSMGQNKQSGQSGQMQQGQ